jgi:hypothetical protein
VSPTAATIGTSVAGMKRLLLLVLLLGLGAFAAKKLRDI